MEFRQFKPDSLIREDPGSSDGNNGIVIKVITGHLANVRGPMDEDTTNMGVPGWSACLQRPSGSIGSRRTTQHSCRFWKDLSKPEDDIVEKQQFGLFGPGDHVEFKSGRRGGTFSADQQQSQSLNCRKI